MWQFLLNIAYCHFTWTSYLFLILIIYGLTKKQFWLFLTFLWNHCLMRLLLLVSPILPTAYMFSVQLWLRCSLKNYPLLFWIYRTIPFISNTFLNYGSPESSRWPTVGRYRVDVASFESVALPELQVLCLLYFLHGFFSSLCFWQMEYISPMKLSSQNKPNKLLNFLAQYVTSVQRISQGLLL